MKTSNHHIYYAAGLSWDFIERLVCKTGGNSSWHTKRTSHRPYQRYHKNRCWNKQARAAIKKGKVDGINLKNYYE